MVCSLKIGESNKLIGWVYESNREKVKQAQKDLDDFYRDDALNDLQQTKDKELEILDERINNWNKYLTALKQRYDAWQVQEEQKLLMELTNAKTEEELYQKILDDMLNYNEKAAGHYDDYIGIFENFLDDYKTNLEKLQELKELEREYMSPDYYLGTNNGNFNNIQDLLNGNKNRTIDLTIDYSAEMEKAIAAGDLAQAKYLLTLRDEKADILGIKLGQGNYRSNAQVISDAMKKFGMTSNGIVKNASTTLLNKSIDYALEIQKAIARGDYDDVAYYADLRTQKAKEKGINLGTGVYKSNDDIIREALDYYGVRYTEDLTDGIGYLASNGDAMKLLAQAENSYSKLGNNYAFLTLAETNKSNILTQNQTGLLSYDINDVLEEIIKLAGFTVEAILLLAKDMSINLGSLLDSLENSSMIGSSNLLSETSKYGFGDVKYSSDIPYVNLNENYTALANEALDLNNFELAEMYAWMANQKVQSSDYTGTIGSVVYNPNTGKYEGLKKSVQGTTKAINDSTKVLNGSMKIMNYYSSLTANALSYMGNIANEKLDNIESNQKNLIQTINTSTRETLEQLRALGKEVVDGVKMSTEEREQAISEGKYVYMGDYTAYDGKSGTLYLDPNKKPVVYNSADKDHGIIGSQAWLKDVRNNGKYTWTEDKIIKTYAQITADNIERQVAYDIVDMKKNPEYAGKTITTGPYTVKYNERGYAVSKKASEFIIDNEEKAINYKEIANADAIERNIELVAKTANKAGYRIDSVGGVIASQIASSSKEEITQELANALVSLMISTGISSNTASLVNSSDEISKLMSTMGGSVDSAIEYLKNIDASTKEALNNNYKYSGSSGGGSSSSGGGSSSSGKYKGTSDYGFGDASYSKSNPSINLNENYTALANEALAKGDINKAKEYADKANKKTQSSDYKGSIAKVEYNSSTGKYEGVKKPGYASGLENGPVTYTGLAMLHGTPSAPEYVLNNDQAYNLLYNMSSAKMAEFESTSKNDGGVQYIVQGDIVLEGIDDPSKFWQEVTTAMGNRWNVTKNK